MIENDGDLSCGNQSITHANDKVAMLQEGARINALYEMIVLAVGCNLLALLLDQVQRCRRRNVFTDATSSGKKLLLTAII